MFGVGDLLTDHPHRFYGVSFEAPLFLAERLLGLADSRAVYLLRHLLTHLFFLTGGFFCWLLALRLFADRRLALFALLLYLLHPRLYAHSFFNSKDVPFLAAFMISLWLVERAFRRDTASAFALCGAGVGVLVDLRVMGLALFAAVPGLRMLDLLLARDGAGRPPRAGHRGRLLAGRRGNALRGRPLALERPARRRRCVRDAGPVSESREHPLSGRDCAVAVDSAPLPAHVDGGHHAAGRPPADPGRRRGGGMAGRRPPPRRAAQHRVALRVAAARLPGSAARGRRGR